MQLLGGPITMERGMLGGVMRDEKGWSDVKALIPVRGARGEGMIRVVGGGRAYPWTYTTMTIELEVPRKKVDLLTGEVSDFDPGAYLDVGTQVDYKPELLRECAATGETGWHVSMHGGEGDRRTG